MGNWRYQHDSLGGSIKVSWLRRRRRKDLKNPWCSFEEIQGVVAAGAATIKLFQETAEFARRLNAGQVRNKKPVIENLLSFLRRGHGGRPCSLLAACFFIFLCSPIAFFFLLFFFIFSVLLASKNPVFCTQELPPSSPPLPPHGCS